MQKDSFAWNKAIQEMYCKGILFVSLETTVEEIDKRLSGSDGGAARDCKSRPSGKTFGVRIPGQPPN